MFKPGKISLARREALAGYAFIIPWVIGFLIFTIGPMLSSLYFSVHRLQHCRSADLGCG